MKLTIIPSDGAVYKDGLSYTNLDLSSAPINIHALQWNDTRGWIEFVTDDDFNKPSNQYIDQLPEWVEDALLKLEEAIAAYNLAQQQAIEAFNAEQKSNQQSNL